MIIRTLWVWRSICDKVRSDQKERSHDSFKGYDASESIENYTKLTVEMGHKLKPEKRVNHRLLEMEKLDHKTTESIEREDLFKKKSDHKDPKRVLMHWESWYRKN